MMQVGGLHYSLNLVTSILYSVKNRHILSVCKLNDATNNKVISMLDKILKNADKVKHYPYI